VHEIAARLRPGILDNLGLVAALEWQAEDFQTRTGIRCQTSLPEIDVDLDQETATTIFRCAQALMTNVLLHAQARSVTLVYAHGSDSDELIVADDGVGIDPTRLNDPRSYGLIGIRERTRALGGTFTIGRGEQGGTLARVTIPARGREVRL
jgi:signal transduction histidine kinase